jgi:Zn-dependent M16 (insulinase) family peptidase
MAIVNGFKLLREQALRELNSTARFYRHAKTGCELLSLVSDDENKVFGVNFRTPPPDSTGVAHILEHAVLCGSRKYPVKEPFVELMKSSLNTFLNAMTFPDKTCYPVASQHLRDFYNLIDVYLDAVFYPRITLNTFQQEGWHYELDAVDAPLVYKGVVFNEMKGSYSSPDDMLNEFSQRSLFSDTVYGLDSGGDPRHIPDLTYADFKAFHRLYYHPSNARLFFYGDDDPDERLRLLDSWLSAFDPIAVDSMPTLQKRFSAPQRLTRTFVADADESGADRKAMATVNWMIDQSPDAETDLGIGILEHILIGTPASPLRKALVDSGLGEDIAGRGLDDQFLQPMLSVGLKGIDPSGAEKVEALVLKTLRALVDKGIDRMTVEASLNTIEFRLRENNFGSFPRGIAAMLRSLRTWLYDRDPLAPLAFEAPLRSLKTRIVEGEPYFENLIAGNLLDNPHRTTLMLRPDPEQADREAAAERQRLDAARAVMSRSDLEALVEATCTLKRLQETPDPPEALATIPTLALEDLPRRDKVIPIEVTRVADTQVLYHDLATNGVLYLDLGFDLHVLPADLLPYVPLFARALLETGAGRQDFVSLSQRIGRTTGGIRPKVWISAVLDSQIAAARLFLRAKAVPEKGAELLAILSDVLFGAHLDNQERLQQLVLEEKASRESSLVPRGSHFVDMRLRANLHEADWAEEQIGGVSYLWFLRELADGFEASWPTLRAAMERIRSLLVTRAGMLCNVTINAASWRFEPELASFLAALPLSPVAQSPWRIGDGPSSEALTIPASVNYVGKGANLYRLGFRPSGAAHVVVKYLRTTWLWDKVRVQGGAYGGFCALDHRSGNFTFLSYRDPNLLETLDIYDQTPGFLKRAEPDKTELTRSIIGTIGDIDAYQLPDAKGYTSMQRHLTGETDEIRQRRRDEILGANVADFRAFADALAELTAYGQVVVLGSEQAIRAADARRPGFLHVSKVV